MTPLQKNFSFLAFSNFFFFLGNSFFHLFPVYLSSIGGSKTYIGLVMGITTAVLVVMTWIFRNQIDFIDKKKYLKIAGIFSFFIYVAYFLFANLYTIPFLRFIQGIVFAVGFTFNASLVIDIIPKEKRTSLIGIFGISGALTNALAPFLGEIIIHTFSFRYIFLAAILTSLLWLVFIHLVEPPKNLVITEEHQAPIQEYFSLFPITILFGSIFAAFFAFISDYAKHYHIFPLSAFYLTYTGVLILVRVFFTEKMNHWQKEKMVFSCMLIAFSALFVSILLTFFHSVLLLALSGFLYGTAHAFLYPTINVLFVEKTPKRSGKATLIFILLFHLGYTGAAFFYGVIADITSYTTMYLTAAILTLLGSFFFLFQKRKKLAEIENVTPN